MHFKQLEQLTKDSFNLSTIVYAEETEQSVLDNLMHPGGHSVNSIKVAHYSPKRAPFGVLFFGAAGYRKRMPAPRESDTFNDIRSLWSRMIYASPMKKRIYH